MTRHYYGFAHKYGRGWVDATTLKPIGRVVVFDRLSDLETWENADYQHHERIGCRTAKWHMFDYLWTVSSEYGRETTRDVMRYWPMDAIVRDYRREMEREDEY